jgi:HNH endonuclease
MQPTCPHGQSMPAVVLAALPDSQAGTGRHRCALCSFHAGMQSVAPTSPVWESCEHGNRAPTIVLAGLLTNQSEPGRHKCCICAYTFGVRYSSDLRDAQANLITEERGEDSVAREEGARTTVTTSRYERDPQNRVDAIRIHGRRCFACGFDFDSFYGPELAGSYIEVHHVVPISQLGARPVDPRTDLVPLCSNCHSMAHRRTERLISVA